MPRWLVLDRRTELSHCPVGEAEAGIQKHSSLVTPGGGSTSAVIARLRHYFCVNAEN